MEVLQLDGQLLIQPSGVDNDDDKVITAGKIKYTDDNWNWDNPNFYVQKNGFLHAESGEIAGWNVVDSGFFKNNILNKEIICDKKVSDFYINASGNITKTTGDSNYLIIYAPVKKKITYTFIKGHSDRFRYGFSTGAPIFTDGEKAFGTVYNKNSETSITFSTSTDQYFIAWILSSSNNNQYWEKNYSKYHLYEGEPTISYEVGVKYPSESTDIVFYAGSFDNPQFYVRANGEIKATGLTISYDELEDKPTIITSYDDLTDKPTIITSYDDLTDKPTIPTVATIGGFTNKNTQDKNGGLVTSGTYKVGLKYPSSKTSQIIYAGTYGADNDNNPFFVQADGYLKATSGRIGGWDINGIEGLQYLNGNYLAKFDPSAVNNNNKNIIYVGGSTENKENSKFLVSGQGDVYFKGNIYGWSPSGFKKGLDGGIQNIYTNTGDAVAVEICQGLIIDMRNV